MKVRDAMTSTVITVQPETPLKEVAELLVERRISGVPVVDREGMPLGIVSEADFVTKEAAGADARRHSWLRWFNGASEERHERELVAARTAGDAMSAPAVVIDADRPLSEAAQRMADHRVNRLPVLEDGRLAGILTRADIVRAFARGDDDLQAAAAAALRAVDGLDVVEVRDGVVTLRGTVASEELKHTISAVVRALDGVVAVDDRDVSWLAVQPPPAAVI